MTVELKLHRHYKGPDYSIGRLSVDGKYFCDTLEDTDRGLTDKDSTGEIVRRKIYGRTAIPRGRYKVVLNVKSPRYSQPRYKNTYGSIDGYLPRLLNVKGFEGILIHVGNTHTDTDGCILVGKNTQVGRVTQSKVTFHQLYKKLREASRKGEQIWITIS